MATRNPANDLSSIELRRFFISHLNRIYCAKNQLVDKLPLLGARAHFLDLRQAVDETIDAVRLQIQRMNRIYILMDDLYRVESCVGLTGILDEAFQSVGVPGDSPALRDLSILFYMQNIESIESASFHVLLRVVARLQRPDIMQLLRECYDEAREDKALFKAITKNYL